MINPKKIDIGIVRGIYAANCQVCAIDEAQYNKSVISVETLKKRWLSFN